MLALISQKQCGEALDPRKITRETPAPKIQGYEVAAQASGKPAITLQTELIFAACSADGEGCVDGGQLRPILLESGIDMGALGEIWMQIDVDGRGKLDK